MGVATIVTPTATNIVAVLTVIIVVNGKCRSRWLAVGDKTQTIKGIVCRSIASRFSAVTTSFWYSPSTTTITTTSLAAIVAIVSPMLHQGRTKQFKPARQFPAKAPGPRVCSRMQSYNSQGLGFRGLYEGPLCTIWRVAWLLQAELRNLRNLRNLRRPGLNLIFVKTLNS